MTDKFARSISLDDNRSVSVVETANGSIEISGTVEDPDARFDLSNDPHILVYRIYFTEEGGLVLAKILAEWAKDVK